MINASQQHMIHRVDILANYAAGRVGPGGGPAEDWRPVADAVPCLVATDREWRDEQQGGRERPEDVRRYVVAFADPPPVAPAANHRLHWDAGGPLGPRTLTVTVALHRDPTGLLWLCRAEDRGRDGGA